MDSPPWSCSVLFHFLKPTAGVLVHATMSAPEERKNGPAFASSPAAAAAVAADAAPAASALAARELPSAVNSKKLLDEHRARTGGKVRCGCCVGEDVGWGDLHA